MTMRRRRLGQAGEQAARRYLESLGWEWRGSNIRTSFGEVDLLFFDGEALVAVEVKTRRISTSEVVTPKQLGRISRALEFIATANCHNGPLRVDLVVLTPAGCQHLRNVTDRL
jgi:putative endonuclease